MLAIRFFGTHAEYDKIDAEKNCLAIPPRYVRSFNRPCGVKSFQAIRHSSVDVARGLALLFGIGTEPLHHGIRGSGRTPLPRPIPTPIPADIRTHLIHHPARDTFHRWADLRFSCIRAAATSLVHRNSVPSTQMRCMITANRRARATIAFFIPRCLAIDRRRP